MSNIIQNGASTTVNLQTGEKLAVSAIDGTFSAVIRAGVGVGTALATNSLGGEYGPYASPVVVQVSSSADGLVDFEVGTVPSLDYREAVTAVSNPLTGGISLSAGGLDPLFSARLKRAEKYKVATIRPVMAAPPTITNPADYSGITGAVTLIPYTDSSFTIDGRWAAHPVFGAGSGFYCSDHTIQADNKGTRSSRIEFMTDAPIFAFSSAQNPIGDPQKIMIWLNDQLVSATPITYTANAAPWITHVNCSGLSNPRGPWKVRIDTNNSSYYSFAVGIADRVWPVSYEDTVTVGFLGDSITEGVGTATAQFQTGFWSTVADSLGWKRAINFGKSSIGYLNAGGTFKMSDRLASISSFPLDVLVCAAGINDMSYTQQQEFDEAVSFLAKAKQLMPNTKLFIVGPFAAPGQVAPQGIFDGIKAACLVAGVTYIDTKIPSAWQFGTGKVGATTGNGNSDFYISSDNVHPSQAGHDYLAQRIVQQIAAAIRYV